MRTSFDFFIFYSQLVVFNIDLEFPFNNWRPEHDAQGFAWRKGSVSFSTLEDSGDMRVEVVQAAKININPKALRAIIVPFFVSNLNNVGISDLVHEAKMYTIPSGDYGLLYETGYNEDSTMWFCLTFIPDQNVQPEIFQEGIHYPHYIH